MPKTNSARRIARRGWSVAERLWWRAATLVRTETVLVIAAILAAVSCVLVPPDAQYAAYIDLETLGKLFALMLVMAGFQRVGAFRRIAAVLLGRVRSLRGIALVLVGLCFFSSMFITNDVALVTFVPLALLLLGMVRADDNACLVVTLMTVAANLGSMAMPMGNPQNLYLYSVSGMDMGSFITLMAPYTVVSAVLLTLAVFVGLTRGEQDVAPQLDEGERLPAARVALYAALFAVCLACVAGILDVLVAVGIVAIVMLVVDRGLFRSVDYGLLLTFVAFYIFVGNLERFAPFHDALATLVQGREFLVSVVASQVISNVPAALLLSGFTGAWSALIVGTNVGGLGTLIASMASLISYKQLTLVQPGARKRFLVVFTLVNVAFLAVLAAMAFLLGMR